MWRFLRLSVLRRLSPDFPERALRPLVWFMPLFLVVGNAPAEIALSLVALTFLARCAIRRDWVPLRQPWMVVALILWGYLVVIGLVAAIAGGDTRPLGRALIWGRFALFAAALQSWLLRDAASRIWMLLTTAATLGLVAVDAVTQYLRGLSLMGLPSSGHRLTAPFGEPKVGAFTVRFMFPVALFLLWDCRSRPCSDRTALGHFATATVVFGGLAGLVLVSGDRMPILLLGLGIALIILLASGRPWGAMAVAVVVTAVVVFGMPEAVRVVHARIADFWNTPWGHAMGSGFAVWQTAPEFGVGPGMYRKVCPTLVAQFTGPLDERCFTHPHNFYIEWLAEAGVVGLLGFCVLVGSWLWHYARTYRIYWRGRGVATGTVIAVVLMLWPLASTMSFFGAWNGALFWLVLGWSLAETTPLYSRAAPQA